MALLGLKLNNVSTPTSELSSAQNATSTAALKFGGNPGVSSTEEFTADCSSSYSNNFIVDFLI